MTWRRGIRVGVPLVGAIVTAGLAWHALQPRADGTGPARPPAPLPVYEGETDAAGRVSAREAELDRTVWAVEVESEHYEDVFVQLADALRQQPDHAGLLAGVALDSLQVPTRASVDTPRAGIVRRRYAGATQVLEAPAWARWLEQHAARGWRVVHTEWRHEDFDPQVPASVFETVWHVENAATATRTILRATFHVTWTARGAGAAPPRPRRVQVTRLETLTRRGTPPFAAVQVLEPYPEAARGSRVVEPLLLHDLDGDGRTDVVFAGANTVYWNRGDFHFEPAPLCRYPPRTVLAAVLGDFTGDGITDFLCTPENDYPLLYRGTAAGTFPDPGEMTRLEAPLVRPLALTAGDLDADGDLDVWVSQYRPPFLDGQMPTPYYDANDGHPAYLLENLGGGRFADITRDAGLAPKRHRRTYSNSFVDYDADGDLDLLVVSDFSGVDVYRNEGRGRFTDVTATAVDERANFGMAHAFADWNGDARLDWYVIGMSSAVARRLDRLGLGRPEFPEHQRMRPRMSYGNRLYLGQPDGTFRQAPFADRLARSQWSWGVTAFDADNDGHLDLYVANGHQTRRTLKDYCPRFWCHDIYLGTSQPDSVLEAYFQRVGMEILSAGISWDGFQHNHLFLDGPAHDVLDAAFLFGLAAEYDGRAVASDDLDGDGRVDLLVVEGESLDVDRPPGERLHVYANRVQQPGHWLAVRLLASPGRSPLGACVRLETDRGVRAAWVVCGDSFRTQHAPVRHFGLGRTTRVHALEVRWPDGHVDRIPDPARDRVHVVGGAPAP